MKPLLYLFLIFNTPLFGQDSLSFSEEFVVPLDVFKESSDGKMTNYAVEFSDLYFNYFILKSEFEPQPNLDKIFITSRTVQDVISSDVLVEIKNNSDLKIKGDSVCLDLTCYIDYIFEQETNHYWRKKNNGENLEFVKFYCEFKCVKVGNYSAKIISPLARCKKKAYIEKDVDVYEIYLITKIVPVKEQ